MLFYAIYFFYGVVRKSFKRGCTLELPLEKSKLGKVIANNSVQNRHLEVHLPVKNIKIGPILAKLWLF